MVLEATELEEAVAMALADQVATEREEAVVMALADQAVVVVAMQEVARLAAVPMAVVE